MKKTFLPFLVVLAVAAFFYGMYSQNPTDSRTPNVQPLNVHDPVVPQTDAVVKYVDSLNGNNDTTALKTRGYKLRRGAAHGPIGTTYWFQGNSGVFAAFNGPATGYVGANFNATTGTNTIDLWLILPSVNVAAGDTISFYERSPSASTFPDSIRVYYASNGDTNASTGSWVELGKFKTTTTGSWAERRFVAPSAGANGRFAINYRVANGGPTGANSDFIGIDFIRILGPAAPPLVQPNIVCDKGTIPQFPTGVFGHATAIIGDTLYVVGGNNAGGASTTVARCYLPTGTWSAGNPIPVATTGSGMVSAQGRLFLIGGGSALSTAGATTNCYSYNPGTGQWTAIAPLPTAQNGHGVQVWGDSVIFSMSGSWTTPITSVFAYRINSNTWITSTPVPTGRRSFASGIYNNKLYVMAGFAGAFRKDVLIGTIGSNASTITWVTGPDVPLRVGATGSSRPGGTVLGDRYYFITGETTPAPTTQDSIYVMNTQTDTWTSTILTGRGTTGTASNYWDAVEPYTLGGNGSVLIVGGALGTAFPGLFNIQVGTCLTGVTQTNNELPQSYTLSQNYPNPFNPTTNIKFSIPQAGFVKLTVFDVLGREVSVLINEVKTAGNYVADFDASSLASGVYFYSLESGNFKQTKKMLLVK